MSSPPKEVQPPARRSGAWRLVWLVPLLLVLVAAAVYFWWPRPVAEPPILHTTGLDPEVAATIEQAQQRLRDNPRSAAAWGELGMVLFAYDIYKDAALCLAQAESLDSSDARWPYLQGLALNEFDPPRALACLDRAANLAGNDYGPHLRYAEALLQHEQIDEAERAFQRTLDLHPRNPRALLGLGRAALVRNALAESLGHLTLVESSPVSQRAAHAAMAEVYRRQGDEEAAARADQRARTLPPDQPWADPLLAEVRSRAAGSAQRLERARELWQSGDTRGCLALLEENLRKRPNDADSHALLGAVQFSQQNQPAAEAALREALRLNSEDTNSQVLLGVILLQQKRLPQASEAFRQVLKTRPTSTDAAFNLCQCLVQQGDRAGAIEVLRTALRFRPDVASLHVELGNQLLQAGKPDEAVPVLQQAVALAPADMQAQKLLEDARRQSGRTP